MVREMKIRGDNLRLDGVDKWEYQGYGIWQQQNHANWQRQGFDGMPQAASSATKELDQLIIKLHHFKQVGNSYFRDEGYS